DNCDGDLAVSISDSEVSENGCARSQTRTFSAEDGCGNGSSATRTISWIEDTTAPVFGALTSSDFACINDVTFQQATATDNCSDVELTYEDEIEDCRYTTYSKGGWGSPSNSTSGQIRDENFATVFPNGLTIGCSVGSFLFTNAQAIEVYVPSGGGAAVLPAGVTPNPSADVYSNNFADQLIAATLNTQFDAALPSFGLSQGTLGNLTFASGTFAGMTVNSVIAIANDVIGGCSTAYSGVELSAAMEAVNLSFHEGGPSSGALNCIGDSCSYTITRTWTATDACGNSSTATQTINVNDNIAPVVTATGSVANNSNLGCNPSAAAIDAALGSATAVDNCSGSVNVVATDGAVTTDGCTRTQTRTFTATDDCNNSSSATRTISWKYDVEAPVITATGSVANNSNIGCNPSAAAINAALGTATANDLCDGSRTVTSTDGAVTTDGCTRTQTRTFSSIDICGNSSTETRTINWKVDITAPVVTATGSVANNSNIGCNPSAAEINAALGTATAFDNCDGDLPATSTDGAISSDGCTRTQTRTFSSTDICGNTGTATRTISWKVDLVAPVITATGSVANNSNLGCNPSAAAINAALG
ncbi:MAG: hypothetical protein ACKO7B_14780, partial [Flavobacteriales bacterium]